METLIPRYPHEQMPGFIFRPRWFLVNRFFAVVGVAGAILSAKYLFRIETIRYRELWVLATLLFISNLAYYLYYRLSPLGKEHDLSGIRTHLTVFTIVQINVDLVILTLMLHYSGGATNPFVFYYFFHTMLASILLSKPLAYLEAFIAALLFGAMIGCEGMKIIPHYYLLSTGAYNTPTFMFGMWTALSSALFIAVYMGESIVDRLRMHQSALEKSLAETKRLETEKSRFLNVVAHDLKSPLASIQTMVTSVLAVHGEEIPPSVRLILERVPVRTGELLRFISELLDFSRVRNVADIDLPFETLDLAAVVMETVEIHADQAYAKGIALTTAAAPGIPKVCGNRELMGRLTSNLISNAIRYTPEKGSVSVSVDFREGEVVLIVSDTGIGIPEEDIPGIFTDFFRAKNARKFSPTGTGLGLSITRSIAEMHGGTVSVTSKLDAGTTFTVRLPAAVGRGKRTASLEIPGVQV